MEKPYLYATREELSGNLPVTSLAILDGKMFDGSYAGIFETRTGKRLDGINNNFRDEPVLALDVYDGHLIAASMKNNLFGNYDDLLMPGVLIQYADTGKEIFRLGERFVTWNNRFIIPDLDFRPCSVDMAVLGEDIYVSSQNVVKFKPEEDINMTDVVTLTDYRGDFVRLASDGNMVYEMSSHNKSTHPDGDEIRVLPEGKRVMVLNSYVEDKEDYHGFGRMMAAYDGRVVVGTSNFIFQEHDLYMFNLKDDDPAIVPLLKDEICPSIMYGKGNPIIVRDASTIDNLI